MFFFLFLVTILIIAMFNFQFWVRMRIGSWYYLTCCISLLFSHFWMYCLTNHAALGLLFLYIELHAASRSNFIISVIFVKLPAIQLVVILFHLTAFTDLILYDLNTLHYWSKWTGYSFFHVLSSFARSQVKTLIVKFRLLPRKCSISGILLTFLY